MRRSGNHAIAAFLARNAPEGRSIFLNDCRPGLSPLEGFRGIEVNGVRSAVKAAQRDLAAAVAPAGEGALLILSYEDLPPDSRPKGGPISGAFDETLITADLLVHRGFLNWAASLLRKVQGNPAYGAARRGALVLGALDGYARMLALAEASEDLGLTCLRYDDWCAAASAREALLEELGLPARDLSLGPVQPYGGGSSFQKEAVDGAELRTDARWREMADDPEYAAILSIARRDGALMDRLARHYPEDAERLSRLPAAPRLFLD